MALKAKLAEQQAHLKQLSDHMYVSDDTENSRQQLHDTNDSARTVTRLPGSRAARTTKREILGLGI